MQQEQCSTLHNDTQKMTTSRLNVVYLYTVHIHFLEKAIINTKNMYDCDRKKGVRHCCRDFSGHPIQHCHQYSSYSDGDRCTQNHLYAAERLKHERKRGLGGKAERERDIMKETGNMTYYAYLFHFMALILSSQSPPLHLSRVLQPCEIRCM